MCNRRIENGFQLGYANAAIDLFQAGRKVEGAWLLFKAGIPLEQYLNMSAHTGEMMELAIIFDYIEKAEIRAQRKTERLNSRETLSVTQRVKDDDQHPN